MALTILFPCVCFLCVDKVSSLSSTRLAQCEILTCFNIMTVFCLQFCDIVKPPAQKQLQFASVATTTSSSRLWHNHASPCGPWPQESHWCRRFYEISRHGDHVCLFCSFTSASGHLPLGGLSSSATSYRGWTIAMQCWLEFHYTLHGACNRWWTRPPHDSWLVFASSKCDHISHAALTPITLAES